MLISNKKQRNLLVIGLIILICSPFTYAMKKCTALYPFYKDKDTYDLYDKYGYIDCRGHIIIEPNFEFASEFRDSVGIIHVDDNSDGIVNIQGKVKILPGTDILSNFYEGVAVARINGKYGIIDKEGKTVALFAFEVVSNDYHPASTNFSDGVAAISTPKGTLFVNKTGNVDLKQKEIIKTEGFRDGLATITFENSDSAVIDKMGRYIVKPISFKEQSISIPSEGLIVLGKHIFSSEETPNWKYINKTGKIELEVSYDYAGEFVEEMAKIEVDGKWGYMNKRGYLSIPAKFDEADNFSEGLAKVRLGDKYGFVNRAGDLVIPLVFDYVVSPYTNGLAYVQNKGLEGYINKTGKWIWKKKILSK